MVFNLWWTWQPDARRLFRDLDPGLWDRTNHNPLRMLQLCAQHRLEQVAENDDFRREMDRVYTQFKAYMGDKETYGKLRKGSPITVKNPVAYFSAEFGFHESFPNYSGGLGLLSGDHCKSASDLDIPFIAFTLLYRHGYFRQQIDKDGNQISEQLNQDFSHLPVTDALDKDGKLLFVTVKIDGRDVRA
jgi:glucan phosphorylase